MKHIVVTESFESIPISDSGEPFTLTPIEADELQLHCKLNGLEESLVRITRNDVTFINYVGFIQLRSCSIEILPKVSQEDPTLSRRVLLRMLQRTGWIDVHESLIGSIQIEKMNLFEIIAFLFTRKLLRELHKGVYHTYQEQHDVLPTVRGRIHLAAQVKLAHSKSTLVCCTYDEFQADHRLNRFIKCAVRAIASASRNLETRTRANQALLYLDEVEDVHLGQLRSESFVFDRRNQRFEESYRLAKLLLFGTSPTSAAGRTQNSSILFKMNDLFEWYIAYLINRISSNVIVKDRSHKLLVKDGTKQQGVFQLEPDLLIKREPGRALIIDTKWKRIRSSSSRHGVQREDFYQMYAYLTRYQSVNTVVLLYPHHAEIMSESGVCLESWCLEQDHEKRLKVYSINYEDEAKCVLALRRILDIA